MDLNTISVHIYMEVIMNQIKYDKNTDTFRCAFACRDSKVYVNMNWKQLVSLYHEIDKAIKEHKTYLGISETLRDTIVAKQIISQKKVTGKFPGMRKEDFGL